MSIRKLAQTYGEETFRVWERETICQIQVDNHIISIGGGALLTEQNVAHLKKLGTLIYLEASKERIKGRMLTAPLPTFLDPNDPAGSFERMWCTRKGEYERICDVTIQLEGKSDTQILEELWRVINSETSFGSPHGENHTEKPSVL